MINEEVIIIREKWECRECKELAEELGETAQCNLCRPKKGKLMCFIPGFCKVYGIVKIGSRFHKIPIDRLRLPDGD